MQRNITHGVNFLEPLSIISVILQLASAAPQFDKLLQNNVNRTYTRTETIEFYRSNMNKNIFEQNDN
jgi:hypothetical protein